MTYKQIHGCAMASPVSPVVAANICMEVNENTAFEMTSTKPKTWKRFVDDSFSIIKKTAINSFLNLLNDIDPNISFTIELEQDSSKISFLDTLITRPQVTSSKLTCLGNLLIQTGILTLTHITTLNTKLVQPELLNTGHKHYQIHILASKTNSTT